MFVCVLYEKEINFLYLIFYHSFVPFLRMYTWGLYKGHKISVDHEHLGHIFTCLRAHAVYTQCHVYTHGCI